MIVRSLLVTLFATLLLVFVPLPPAPAASFDHARIGDVDGAPTLLVDGKPFFFFGGAFFYTRIPPEDWEPSLTAMRRLGANTLDIYVPWNWHEVADGQFDFDGRTNPRRNLRRLLRLAASLDMHLIVRPGPMARNEWRNGGYPAWLLEQSPYHMSQHDILEGRYAATATLQNAHSDAAATEWLRNPLHMRYAARWLRTVMGELRPYANRVLAIQLDDDQGAYTDNQTWPAPHFHRYMQWIEGQIRAVAGPVVPTFINTFDMKVPASAPAWAMGNWYGTALRLGEHDRTEFDFATATLTTQERVPLAFSEFQAGWLAAPEDPQPRIAEPANTALAFADAIGWGARGVIVFPLQDTLAPFGWEAPFSNALYAWDAALPREPFDAARGHERFAPTAAFGATVAEWGPLLAQTHRFAAVAVAYGISALDERRLDRAEVGTITARFKEALRICRERGITCDAVDLRFASMERLRRYRTLVVPPLPRPALPSIARRLTQLRAGGVSVVDDVPDERGNGIVALAGRDASFGVASNWTDAAVTSGGRVALDRLHSVDIEPVSLAPRSARLLVLDLRLRTVTPAAPDVRVTSSCRLFVASGELIADAIGDQCSVIVRDGAASRTIALSDERLHVASGARDRELPAPRSSAPPAPGDRTALASGVQASLRNLRSLGAAGAIAYRNEAFGAGDPTVVLQNAKLRVVVAPDGGARIVVLQRIDTPDGPLDATNATGALRDDALQQPSPSRTDRIARYTHSYPAGLFNRPYKTEILSARGRTAAVRFSYVAPDVVPRGARFEKTLTLAADAPRLVVDERVIFVAGRDVDRQRAVSYAALAIPPSVTVPDPRDGLAAFTGTAAIAVSWAPGSLVQAIWTPYTSNGTLMLVTPPGTLRTTYAVAPAKTADEATAFARGERAWIAANPELGAGLAARASNP